VIQRGSGSSVAAPSACSGFQRHSRPPPGRGRQRHTSFGRRVRRGRAAQGPPKVLSFEGVGATLPGAALPDAALPDAACRWRAVRKFSILKFIAHLHFRSSRRAGGSSRLDAAARAAVDAASGLDPGRRSRSGRTGRDCIAGKGTAHLLFVGVDDFAGPATVDATKPSSLRHCESQLLQRILPPG
jgi:hypothetical protein